MIQEWLIAVKHQIAIYLRNSKLFFRFFNYKDFYYKKELGYGEKHVCILIPPTSYVFLNAAFPVVAWLKNCHCRTTLVFLGEKAEKEYKNSHPEKFAELEQYVDNIILYEKGKYKTTIQKEINKIKFRAVVEYLSFYEKIDTFLFSSYHLDSLEFKEMMNQRFPYTRKVTLSDGAFFFKSERLPDLSPLYMDHVLFTNQLACGSYQSEFAKHIDVIRSAKLDPWWQNQCLDAEHLKISQGLLNLKYKTKIVCAFSRLVLHREFSEKERQMFFEALLAFKQEFSFIFKFHPGDERSLIDDFIAQWIPDGVDWVESELDLFQLTAVGDVYIAVGLTSSIAEVILGESPIILFYNNHENIDVRKALEVMLECNGGVEDEYVYRGLVMHANNAKELQDLVYTALREGKKNVNALKFQKYLPEEEHACEKIAEILLED